MKVLEVQDTRYRVIFLSADSEGKYKPGDRPPVFFRRDRFTNLRPGSNVLEWCNYYNRLNRYAQIQAEKNARNKPEPRADKVNWELDYVIAWRRYAI